MLMENRAGYSGETSTKSRLLDLQSLYKSTASVEQRNNRKKSGVVYDEKDKKKKRKRRREVPPSSLELECKKSRESVDEACDDGVSSDSPNSGKLQSWLSRKLHNSSGFNRISLNLDDGSGNIIQIPKRRRGFIGRKRVESVQVSRSLGDSSGRICGSSSDQIINLKCECKKSDENGLAPPDDEVNSADQRVKSNDDSASQKVLHPKVRGKKRIFEDSKVHKTSRVKSARRTKEDDGHLIVDNKGDESSIKRHRNNRKKTDLALCGESLAKKVEPLADSLYTIFHNSQDEYVENLEQNAARMLSSRFDPSCTGISSKNSSFASRSRNGSSFVVSSADIASRTLRPRTRHKGKGLFRKRRHFYEIFSKDVDAYWVLNRRIKIFWPLDESWYYGLVNEYDPRRDLHHIKYDDRDEEWINLQNERFKLLVFPSEIPPKMEKARGTTGNRHDKNGKRDSVADDDSFISCYTDSEPIISWLARSSRRVKSSPMDVSRRHKTSHPSSNFVQRALSAKTNDANGCLDMGFGEKDTHESSSYALPGRPIDARRGKKSVLEGTSSSIGRRSPIVYFRRRFHKAGKELYDAPDDNNTCGSSPLASTVQGYCASEGYDIFLGHTDSEGLLWSVDNSCLLKLTIRLVKSKEFRYEIGSSVSVLRYIGADDYWLFHTMLLLHYGTVTITWPKIHLEMLFVDSFDGLRFLLFEGCLNQAVTFVFLILAVFDEPNEQSKYADMQIPATSIRFKLSCIENLRKQHVFAFFSFSKVKKSKWLSLECELRQHCLLSKQLPVSECTYDNIKALDDGRNQMHISTVDRELSAFEGWSKKSMAGVRSVSALKESSGAAMSQYSSNSDAKHGKLLPFSLSFSAAPTFFLSLHLKLLMENSVACTSLRDHVLMNSREGSENTGHPDSFTLIESCSECVSEIIPQCKPKIVESHGWLLCPQSHLGAHVNSECNDGGLGKSSQYFKNDNLSMVENSACSRVPAENSSHVILQSQKLGCNSLEFKQHVALPESPACENLVCAGVPDSGCYSTLTGLSVEIPFLDQGEKPANGKTPNSPVSTDLAWDVNDATGHNPYPRGPRSIWHHNRDSLNFSSGDASQLWPNGRTHFIRTGFGHGPKKPRTQVHYALPSGVVGLGATHKMHAPKGIPSKRIRKAGEKRTLDDSRNSHRRNLELLACDANVLITIGDRGWRECGAQIVLELVDHNEWRFAVKLTGMTKYSYKAHQFLQPGSTNRYTHAMMWKGGKDWVLEFPDRSQWVLFKEMHEECYNRNIRAASVKNIPIPGVRLIEECDDNGIELPFICSSPMYFQQVETDVEIAMDPLRILYDMDSDDEKWISENHEPSHDQGSKCKDISEELFEKTMDAFEKVAYAEQRDRFTSDEMEKFMGGVGPLEVIKLIHKHWRLKRQRKGMPLIRHLQPPLWERYEQQLKEWEHAIAKANGCQGKAPPMEKPPIYAFCLKPRGLEIPNKCSKQRSHRKFSVSGHSHTFLSDHDGLHAIGRRSNGYGFGDEKVMFHGNSSECSDASPLNNDWSDWNHPKLHRNKSKKIGTVLFPSPNSPQMLAPYTQRTTIGKRNGVHRWNMTLPEWPSHKHYQLDGSLRQDVDLLDSSNLDEFRLREASGAAHRALSMARLKREKAQRLLYRADLAIHKAVVALNTAEAMKSSSSSEDPNGIAKNDHVE